MRVALQYGSHGLWVTVPEETTVLRPRPVPALVDPEAAVHAALDEQVRGRGWRGRAGQRAAVVVSDVTRLMPNAQVLGPLLELLEADGVRREDVTIVIGTGLHRPSRRDELLQILGETIPTRYRVVDHVARDADRLAPIAGPGAAPLLLARAYVEAELRILTGFVEPHLFAGYSGGGKAVLPGIAGAEQILANHSARHLADPGATWCQTAGNPVFEEMRAAAAATAPSFIVNVTLDEQRRLTGVFAGPLAEAHDAAIAQSARQALCPLPQRFDLVLTTNMGHPADLSLYQSVKGLSVAARACAPGGVIVLCAECREGLGSPEYAALLRTAADPAELLERLPSAPTAVDQWQVQVQARVQARHEVYLHSALPRRVVEEEAHLRDAADLDATVAALLARKRAELGRPPTLCVLPCGQLTVPWVTADAGPDGARVP